MHMRNSEDHMSQSNVSTLVYKHATYIIVHFYSSFIDLAIVFFSILKLMVSMHPTACSYINLHVNGDIST